jgi:hypothetical protein
MLVKDNPNYRKLTQKKIQNKKLPKDLKPVLKCDKNSLKFWQLFNIRNAILCKYSFPNLGGSMFVENWPQQEKSLQKNTAKITEAAEEQVFVSLPTTRLPSIFVFCGLYY